MEICDKILSLWIQDPSQVISTYPAENWRWIHVKKYLPSGEIQSETREGETVPSKHSFAYHIPSGELYHPDAASTVSMKALYMLLGNPVLQTLRASLRLSETIGKILWVFMTLIASPRRSNDDNTRLSQRNWCLIPETLSREFQEIFEVFWLGLGIEIAAFYTYAFDPFKGRSIISQIEQKLNKKKSFTSDIRIRCMQAMEQNAPIGWRDATCFLGLCFQGRGKISDTTGSEQRRKYEIMDTFSSYADFAGLNTIFPEASFPGFPLIPHCQLVLNQLSNYNSVNY